MATDKRMKILWDSKPVKHGNYTDLGNYILDLGDFSEEDLQTGIEYNNKDQDNWPKGGCTAVVKRNKLGEVIVGRNQDMEISNYPGFISHIKGKYKAIGFFYDNKGPFTYEQFKEGVDFPADRRCATAASSTDAFNEKGLYIQTNMRTGFGIKNSGTKPGARRIGEICLGALAAVNCATVQEVVAFAKTLDIYSMGDPESPASWSFAFLIADATGDYGVLEFANNKVYFTPYASGHANAFVAPSLVTNDPFGAGYGRLEAAMRYLPNAEDEYDMMKAIGYGGWSHEIQDIKYSYKDKDGYVHFEDEFGAPSIDYRSEMTGNLAVDAFGNVVDEDGEDMISGFLGYYYPKAYKERYDNLKKFVNYSLHMNCTKEYVLNNDNFDKIKAGTIKYFEKQNAFNNLEKYFNGDEKGLRDVGVIFTTGMRFGVNCTKKHLVLRYFENEKTTIEYQW